MTEYATIKFRRGTQSEVNQYTPTVGEMVWSTDGKRLYIGDGYSMGGRSWLDNATRDTLDSYRTYGVDRYGVRGYHSAQNGIDCKVSDMKLGGGAASITTFGFVECVSMEDAVDSSVLVNIDISPMWDITHDVNVKILYSLEDGAVGEDVRLKGEWWVKGDGDEILVTADGSGTDYINCDVNENDDMIEEICLYNACLGNNALITADKKRIIFKLTREGGSTGDTYTGSFNLVKMFLYQASNAHDYGYYIGGCDYTQAVGNTSSIDRITFPFNTGDSTVMGTLTSAKQGMSACNSSTSAYISGGTSADETTDYSTVDRIAFPFNSGTTSASTNIDTETTYPSGCNCSSYGYVIGGKVGANSSNSIKKQWFQFENDTYSTDVGDLSGTKHSCASVNTSIYGYVMGGYEGASPVSTIDKFSFSYENGTATNVANLASTTNLASTIPSRVLNMVNGSGTKVGTYSAGSFNSSQYGYISGGFALSSISRLDFSSDGSGSELRGNLKGDIKSGVCGCNSSNHGYSMGGAYYGINTTSFIERINFSFDDADAVLVGNLSTSQHVRGAAIDGVDFGSQFI